jgi:hypothetical protein
MTEIAEKKDILVPRVMDVIPVRFNQLPVPFRVMSEAQYRYLQNETLIGEMLQRYDETKVLPTDYHRLVKHQLDIIKLVSSLTGEVQRDFEEVVVGALLDMVKNYPKLKNELDERVARKFMDRRELRHPKSEPQ